MKPVARGENICTTFNNTLYNRMEPHLVKVKIFFRFSQGSET
jgi:hypothetical protein